MRLTVILLATIFVKSFQLVSAINDIELQQNHVRLKTIGFTNLLYNFVNSSQTIPQKVSTECWLSIKNTINDDNLSKKFLSISGHFPADYDAVMYIDLGDYDKCLKDLNSPQKPLQYCLSSYLPNWNLLEENDFSQQTIKRVFPHIFNDELEYELMIGMCLPSECKQSEIHTIINHSIKTTYWSLKTVKCESSSIVERFKNASKTVLLSLLVILVATLLVLKAGLNDLFGNKSQTIIDKIFSPKTSFESLSYPKSSPQFDGFTRFRRVGSFLVIWAHIFAPIPLSGHLTEMNFSKLQQTKIEFWMQPFSNMQVTKVLFYLGGCFAAISLRNEKNLTIRKIVNLLFWRFIKMQPLILACICCELILPLIGSGPVYMTVVRMKINSAIEFLPYFLMHISNFKMATIAGIRFGPLQLWTVSVEYQIYIVLLLVLYCSHKTKSSWIVPASIVVSFLLTICYVIWMKIDLIPFNKAEPVKSLLRYFMLYHLTPICNLWPYLLSFYVISLIIEGKFDKMCQTRKRKLFISATIMCGIASFSSSYFTIFNNKFTPLSTCIYMLIVEPAFAFWFVTIALNWGRPASNYVDNNNEAMKNDQKISSSSDSRSAQKKFPFVNLIDHLLLSAYFTHYAAITWIYASTREAIYLQSFNNAILFGQSVLAILISCVIFHFLFLSPISRIQLLMRKSGKQKSQ